MNKIIIGQNINFRLVEIEDAEFILNLRLKKGEFLSATNPNLIEQENWIKNTKNCFTFSHQPHFIYKHNK